MTRHNYELIRISKREGGEIGLKIQLSKGIRQKSINSCTSPMMLLKILWFQLVVKTFGDSTL